MRRHLLSFLAFTLASSLSLVNRAHAEAPPKLLEHIARTERACTSEKDPRARAIACTNHMIASKYAERLEDAEHTCLTRKDGFICATLAEHRIALDPGDRVAHRAFFLACAAGHACGDLFDTVLFAELEACGIGDETYCELGDESDAKALEMARELESIASLEEVAAGACHDGAEEACQWLEDNTSTAEVNSMLVDRCTERHSIPTSSDLCRSVLESPAGKAYFAKQRKRCVEGGSSDAASACEDLQNLFSALEDKDRPTKLYQWALDAWSSSCKRGNMDGCMGLIRQGPGSFDRAPKEQQQAHERARRAQLARCFEGDALEICARLPYLSDVLTAEEKKAGWAALSRLSPADIKQCERLAGKSCDPTNRPSGRYIQESVDLARQLTLLDLQCKAGKQSACEDLGQDLYSMTFNAFGVTENRESWDVFKQQLFHTYAEHACAGADQRSCHMLHMRYLPESAFDILYKEKDKQHALKNLGYVGGDMKRSLGYIASLCKESASSLWCAFEMGVRARFDLTAPDPVKQAAGHFEKACQRSFEAIPFSTRVPCEIWLELLDYENATREQRALVFSTSFSACSAEIPNVSTNMYCLRGLNPRFPAFSDMIKRF